MEQARLSRDPVVFEELTCAFCRGRGRDPFDIMSSLSTCCVCGGSGKVLVQGAGRRLRPLPGNRGRQNPYLYHLRRQGLRPPTPVANCLMSSFVKVRAMTPRPRQWPV